MTIHHGFGSKFKVYILSKKLNIDIKISFIGLYKKYFIIFVTCLYIYMSLDIFDVLLLY